MAAINDLISQIQDETLRNRIQEEVSKMAKQKKFGLVFEEHMPESTPLYDMPIKRGCNVMLRDSKDDKAIYVVLKVEGDTAVCVKPEQEDEAVTFELKDIVRVAEFGESIYPYLKPLDSVCNAPDSDLWHTLIEADNYHALQLLEYLYAGKVDCIYIDPPYNTGAKDWKYNNDYVDGNDAYRHSKWLSFMQRRLKLAKKLLNPADSVLIVTIDEKEYLHLGCLLEEMFSEANMQMISSAINGKGVARNSEFARVNEYIYIVRFGECGVNPLPLPDEWIGNVKTSTTKQVRWGSLMRSGSGALRSDSPGCFYPIFISKDKKHFCGAGEVVPAEADRSTVEVPEGTIALFPVHDDGVEGRWQYSRDKFLEIQRKGYVRISTQTANGKEATLRYISEGWQKKVESGQITVLGRAEDGSVIIDDSDYEKEFIPGNQWWIPAHDATEFGSKLLTNFIGKRFSFPKSLYAVHDVIRFFVTNNPNALIVDFFAGSGTTMHAVNLLNAEDGGHRRCIMVTNNEVSDAEAKEMSKCGLKPGDEEWEKLGIARYVTWPRTVCSIEGHDVNGKPLKGDYLGSEPPIHMADGFKANAAFFKLGFLDPTAVSLGMRFSEMLPTLWLKTGAKGKCPELTGEQVPDMLILPENQFAVLINENTFADFAEKLAEHPEIQTVFLATDYEVNYQSMVKNLNVENAYQLYRDYLDHFRVNRGRN
ncbi:site-specific DNA-methyltransferase [Bariatricus sp. HCP28S3_D3]|uniref:site-specific DNA-methyltransferase n=1 Tax=Bariatricus sp. HCP28S3_D3 TaxID=3438901 RepID=UPI003F8AA47C